MERSNARNTKAATIYSANSEVVSIPQIPYGDHFALEKCGEIFFLARRSQKVRRGTDKKNK